METTRSADGTTIAYDRTGTGPPLVVIGGAFNTRRSPAELVPLLAAHFTVITYDRRGRGDSTDNAPYSVAREIEDLDAIGRAAGSDILVYGHSSGGVLALESAAAGVAIAKVAVYEPPYRGSSDLPLPAGYMERVEAAAAADDREAVARTFFLEAIGMPAAAYEAMTLAPFWPGMLAVAHTIPYDNALVGDGTVPAGRLALIAMPTLVIDGALSGPSFGEAADAVAAEIVDSRRLTLAGQDHAVAPEAVAPALVDFFAASPTDTDRGTAAP